MKWFIEEYEKYGLDRDVLEKEILAKKDKLLESYYVANEIEGEVFVTIKNLKAQSYIDAQVLPNTILVRLVRVLEKTSNEETKEIMYLGEFEVPGKVPHVHEHEYFKGEIRIVWFNEMLKELSVTSEEKNSYVRKVRENVDRIFKAQEHVRELSIETLIAIEGEYEDVLGASITRLVGVYIKPIDNPYICFIEEHARGNIITHYFFKMGKVLIELS